MAKRQFFNSASRVNIEREAERVRSKEKRKIARERIERELKKEKLQLKIRQRVALQASLDYDVLHNKYVEFTNWLADRGDI